MAFTRQPSAANTQNVDDDECQRPTKESNFVEKVNLSTPPTPSQAGPANLVDSPPRSRRAPKPLQLLMTFTNVCESRPNILELPLCRRT